MTFAFFAEGGPVVRIAPAPVLHVAGLTITNSILYGWVCVVLMCVVLIAVARRATIHPKGGVVQLIEAGAEFIISMINTGFDDEKRARKYTPYFVTLFFFLLITNWLGLLPGVGEALTVGGIPLFRGFTGDLNATLAAGVVTMLYVYGSSIREFGGFGKYLRHFFVGNPLNPMFFVIGILEMVTDLTRVFSLSLRLFLNVTIGEMTIAVFSYLGHQAAPLLAAPFTLIELFVGALQAYIFATLSTMYLAAAVNHAAHDTHDQLTPASIPETISGGV